MAELPRPGANTLTHSGFSDSKHFNEADELVSQPSERTRFVKMTERFRVPGARISLSADSDGNEMIAVAIG